MYQDSDGSLPQFIQRHRELNCLRKSPSTTCFSDSRKGCVFDTGSNFTAQIAERSGGDGGIGTNIGVPFCHTDFSLGLSGREQDFSSKNKVSQSVSRDDNIDVCSARSQYEDFHVTVVSRVPDHHSLLPAI